MTTGYRIYQLRNQKGLSQRDLATLLGVSPGSISQFENDKRKPRLETILKLTKVLDCKVSDLTDDMLVPETIYPNPIAYSQIAQIWQCLIDSMYYYYKNDGLRLLNSMRHLNHRGVKKIVDYAQDLLHNPDYWTEDYGYKQKND